MIENLLVNYEEAFAVILFGIGFTMLLFAYINPVPAGLVLTGIVVSVSVTAIMLSLTVRLYRRYHTLQLDEIYEMSKHQTEDR